ncbi:MAG: hypothetical protein ACP5D2_04200, partial [Candidatus Nanoarchaeia archaeon]
MGLTPKEKKIAEFVGIMLGDGSIGVYDTFFKGRIKKHRVVKVTLDSRNRQYFEYVAKLMQDVLGYKPYFCFKKTENTVDIRFFKKEILAYVLKDIGLKISPKWGNMEIPEKYCSDRLSLLVFRGLFDTEGSVTIFNNNGVNTANCTFVH